MTTDQLVERRTIEAFDESILTLQRAMEEAARSGALDPEGLDRFIETVREAAGRAPCAALEGHWNVTMFGPRRQIDWRDRPALARTVPAAVVAVGRLRPGLVDIVSRPTDPTGRPTLF